MRIIRTPTDATPYLDGLNAAFGAWGGAREWDWTFVRTAGGQVADRLVATDDDDRWIAGSGVSWRQVTHVGDAANVGQHVVEIVNTQIRHAE